MNRKIISKLIESKQDAAIRLSEQIWELAETKYEEYQTSQLFTEALKAEGFEVTTSLGDIPTAFKGSYGSGKPIIAILGEFDALPNLSQVHGVTEKCPLKEGGNGHGCGHNLLGAGSFAAAVAIKDYLKDHKIPGTIEFFGCPAEETGAGKAFMVREHCFDQVDICLSWHPESHNRLFTNSLANVRVSYDFHGVSSHAAAAPEMGRSALDACELMSVGVNYLREHIIPEARVHYAVTNTGGNAPNVVQAESSVLYAIRAPKTSQVKHILERVNKVAKGAALMTETTVDINIVTAYSSILRNRTLEKVLDENMQAVFPFTFTDEELHQALEFQKTYTTTPEEPSLSGTYKGDGDLPFSASTDVGDVSWVVPTSQITSVCLAAGTPMHTWQTVAQVQTSYAKKGMINAAKVLAMSAVQLFEDPQLVDAAKKDKEMEAGRENYETLIPPNSKPFI